MKITELIKNVLFIVLCAVFAQVFYTAYKVYGFWFLLPFAFFAYCSFYNVIRTVEKGIDPYKNRKRHYTGCKDKLGRKIYAGDCLIDKFGCVDTVEFRNGEWRVGVVGGGSLWDMCKHYEVYDGKKTGDENN